MPRSLSFISRLRGLLGCLTLVAGVCASAAARAEVECPRLADVVDGLGQVLTTEQAENAAAEIVLGDQGASWSIEVRGHASRYSDPARNCAERARVATVFAALVLEPVDVDDAPTAEQDQPSYARFSVEAGLQLVLSLWAQASNRPVGWGGQARLLRSGEHLGVSLGIQAVAFSRLDLGLYGASITRAACDLSGRASWALGSFMLAGEVGPFLGLLRVRGTGLETTSGMNRLDAGARVAISARLRTWPAPFLALQAELGARRFELSVRPSGEIGRAPRLWLGLMAGAAFDL